MPRLFHFLPLTGIALLVAVLSASAATAPDVVSVESGKLQGVMNSDNTVRIFKGVPFAAAPVGELRWKPPQPPAKWTGIRQADKFGSACLQNRVFGDIYWRDNQPSEDCLNLTIWVPAKRASKKLPVFVWYYGGGFVAGSSSEPRYDGENLAKKGVIVVNANYRLGVFGFLAHPELTKESGRNASGNYGMLDQVAALQWVVNNIAAFGGDPKDITIGGESAGSLSVSGLMASPLSRGLFQKAIGESGAFFSGSGTGLGQTTLADAEKSGLRFADKVGAKSLADLRAKTGAELLDATKPIPGTMNGEFSFGPIIDGYFLPTSALKIYTKGEQAHIPLLAGWNADEGKMMVLFNPVKPNVKSFAERAQKRFGGDAAEFLKLYPSATDQQAVRSAMDLSGDDFIAYGTWKWLDTHRQTGQSHIYQYHFEEIPATRPGEMIGPVPASEWGSKHAGEIEYVFQTLKSQQGVPWTDDDFRLSDLVSSYWTNFIKTGNPNGKGLPEWPKSEAQNGYQVMHLIDDRSHASVDDRRGRYEFLDAHSVKPQVKATGHR